MTSTLSSFEKYIYDDIGISLPKCNRLKLSSLPYFILDEYNLYRTNVLHKECMLLVPKTDQEVSPATVRKHIGIIRDKYN